MAENENTLRAETTVDRDPTRRALLARAIADPAVLATAAALAPAGDVVDRDGKVVDTVEPDPEWKPGAFELAAAVRAHLPPGLAADDFDGQNVDELLES